MTLGADCPAWLYKNALLKPICPHSNSLFTNPPPPFKPYHIINSGSNPLSIIFQCTPISLNLVICTTKNPKIGHKLRLYDTERKKFIRILDKDYQPDNCQYCYLGDNKLLIAKTKHLFNRVEFRVIDINTGKCITSFPINKLGYLTCLTSTSKNRFVTGNQKGLVSLFSLNQRKLLKSSDTNAFEIIEILANKDCKGGYFANLISKKDSSCRICFWDKNGNILKSRDLKVELPEMAYYPSGDILLFPNHNMRNGNKIQLLNFKTGDCIASYVSKNKLSKVTCLKDGNIIFYDWDSKKLKILDILKNKIVQNIECDLWKLKSLPQGGFITAFHPNSDIKYLIYSNEP